MLKAQSIPTNSVKPKATIILGNNYEQPATTFLFRMPSCLQVLVFTTTTGVKVDLVASWYNPQFYKHESYTHSFIIPLDQCQQGHIKSQSTLIFIYPAFNQCKLVIMHSQNTSFPPNTPHHSAFTDSGLNSFILVFFLSFSQCFKPHANKNRLTDCYMHVSQWAVKTQ